MWSEISGQVVAKDQIQMYDLNGIDLEIDQLAKANSVLWYGHELRKDWNNFL